MMYENNGFLNINASDTFQLREYYYSAGIYICRWNEIYSFDTSSDVKYKLKRSTVNQPDHKAVILQISRDGGRDGII